MPVACSQTVLSGVDGSVAITPAATSFCLLDYSDFPAGGAIKLPLGHDFRPGDPVQFSVEGNAKLDSALAAATVYHVLSVTPEGMTISDAKGGAAVVLKGDGGVAVTGPSTPAINGVPSGIGQKTPALPTTGIVYGAGPHIGVASTAVTGTGTGLTFDVTVTNGDVTDVVFGTVKGSGYNIGDKVKILGSDLGAPAGTGDIEVAIPSVTNAPGGTGTATQADTPGSALSHIKTAFAEHLAVCQVQGWTLNLSREEVDTTSLQCGAGTAGGQNAPFRTKQAGYVDGTGSITIRFTRDQESLSRRLLQNSLRKNQDGASVQLFVDTVYDANGKTDLKDSAFIEGPISILGFELGVQVGSEPTEGTINFAFRDQPTNIFGAI
jgi:hypothetical protein